MAVASRGPSLPPPETSRTTSRSTCPRTVPASTRSRRRPTLAISRAIAIPERASTCRRLAERSYPRLAGANVLVRSILTTLSNRSRPAAIVRRRAAVRGREYGWRRASRRADDVRPSELRRAVVALACGLRIRLGLQPRAPGRRDFRDLVYVRHLGQGVVAVDDGESTRRPTRTPARSTGRTGRRSARRRSIRRRSRQPPSGPVSSHSATTTTVRSPIR